MDSAPDQVDEVSASARPITTWVLMFLAVVVVLSLPDWTGSGVLRPIWLFSVPVLLGLIGAGFA